MRTAPFVGLGLVLCIAGCGATADKFGRGHDDGGGLVGGDDGGAASQDMDSIDPGGPDDSDCATGNDKIYLIAADAEFFTFNPSVLKLVSLGRLSCPAGLATPYSMSVDRQGHAWVIFTDGHLFDVDTKTLKCAATRFVPGQSGFTTFGMGFSSDANGGPDETLFVSDAPWGIGGGTKGLARVDPATLKLTFIGQYDKVTGRAEMSGTGDGRLFAAFEGTPYVVAEIDKTSARILSQAPQRAINYAPDSSNFAFAFWGGDFWLFVGPGTSTDVFQYQAQSGMTTKRKTLTQEIVGAGVSTCAPIIPPG